MMLTNVEDDDEEMCTICFDELANGCLKPCGHRFCSTCIKQLKKRAVFLATEGVMCPHCRQPVKEFALPNNNVLSSGSTTKTAWGTSKPTPAPTPIPQPPARLPQPPKPQPPKQSNGPPAAAAAKATPAPAAPAPTPAPATAPVRAPEPPAPAPVPAPAPTAASRGNSQSTFGAFGGERDMWAGAGQAAGSSSLQMPQPGGGGGMGGFGGGGWSSSNFGGLPSLNADPVFNPTDGLWSAGGGSGGLDSWSSGPSAFDNPAGGWDSFQMPGAGGGGGFGGSGFGGLGGGGGSMQQAAFGGGIGGSSSQGSIAVKVKMPDDNEITVMASPSDSGKMLRIKIKELTGQKVTGQQLIFQGKVVNFEDNVENLRITNGVTLNCFPKPTSDHEEAEALRGEAVGLGALSPMQSNRGGGRGGVIGGGLGAIGVGGLMSMDDDRRSDSGSGGRGAGLSQDDDDWEAVGKKKKAGAKAAGPAAGAGPPYTQPGVSALSQDKQGGKTKDGGKMHFFGLWVGNVHSEVVDQEELRACFEGFGELCNSRVHGVPPINILPDSSSAFVNFCRYEDADNARNTLQGRTVAGTGHLTCPVCVATRHGSSARALSYRSVDGRERV
jgi:hypothetical protein